MRELCKYVILQFRLPIIAFGHLLGGICYQVVDSLAYCLPAFPYHRPKLLTCLLLAGFFPAACRCLRCLPVRLFARLSDCLPAHSAACWTLRLPACPYGCLPSFEAACLALRLLAGFRGCLPDLEAACRLQRPLAGFRGRLPASEAACLPACLPAPPAACRTLRLPAYPSSCLPAPTAVCWIQRLLPCPSGCLPPLSPGSSSYPITLVLVDVCVSMQDCLVS